MEEIIADVDRLVVPALTHWSHPAFFAYFATSTSAPGIFGEMLSAAFDVKALLWRGAPAAQELEEVTLSWLRQMIGLPDTFSGIIYDTASVSTLHAIAAAREGLDLRVRADGMSGRTRPWRSASSRSALGSVPCEGFPRMPSSAWMSPPWRVASKRTGPPAT